MSRILIDVKLANIPVINLPWNPVYVTAVVTQLLQL